MLKRFIVYLQYLLPQHLLSIGVGKIANSRMIWLKNLFIQQFIKAYPINMSEAVNEDPFSYATFNDFFTRKLKPALRPIATGNLAIASPVDGTIAQMGYINNEQLLQVKGQNFNLQNLLAGDTHLVRTFQQGAYATLYLAPHNYHCIHMPLTGKLIKTLFVPGKLFSVNQITAAFIPNLYARNERLITLFETQAGPIAIILVGAMIVGSIETVWTEGPVRGNKMVVTEYENGPTLAQGAELGCFKLGSTVILLMQKNAVEWLISLSPQSLLHYGQLMGHLKAGT